MIECDETYRIYSKDIFVLRSVLPAGHVEKNEKVKFCVVQGKQGLEAMDVTILSDAKPNPDSDPPQKLSSVSSYSHSPNFVCKVGFFYCLFGFRLKIEVASFGRQPMYLSPGSLSIRIYRRQARYLSPGT